VHCHDEPENLHFAISCDVFGEHFPICGVEQLCNIADGKFGLWGEFTY
jgi:hypothetical protein